MTGQRLNTAFFARSTIWIFFIRDVHKRTGSALFQLKRFRVRIESDLARLLSVGIQKCQCAVAIADDNTLK